MEVKECDNITCPIEYTMKEIAGKWKLVILWHIYKAKVIRYSDLQRAAKKISHKMLANQLSELVESELINKKIYNQIPPKVEYSLSDKGESLIPVLEFMYTWGNQFIDN